jgi:hypothetical protein
VRGLLARMVYKSNAYRGFLEKFEVKRPLRTARSLWEVDSMEIGRDGIDWIHPSQYVGQLTTTVNAVMNIRVP